LNAPPLIHGGKPDSSYRNTKNSYKSLVDLLTRARLEAHAVLIAVDRLAAVRTAQHEVK